MYSVILSDALEALRSLPEKSVDCCVTSPPYYGLRDYGTANWVGGDINCNHHGEALRTSELINEHYAGGVPR